MKPVSKTAFYCCGVRAIDARRRRPVCGDHLAERFMDDEAWRHFEPFRRFDAPNASNATRHRILDDHLRVRLAKDPELKVVIVGAGFDTRAFRLPGGRWLEVDEQAVLDWKEPRLPAATCPNPLQRLAIDFATETLAERLAPQATDAPVFVVVEGVFMYLGEEGSRTLLRTLRRLFPRAEIGCDLMTREFFERFSRPIHEKIRDLGARFELPAVHPVEIFKSEAFRAVATESVQERAVSAGVAPFFVRLVLPFVRPLREGYQVWVFAPDTPA